MKIIFWSAASAAALAVLPAALPAQDAAPKPASEAAAGPTASGAQISDVLRVQILLDRNHHSPGVIDGMMGDNTRRAILAFEQASGLAPDGRIDAELLDRLEQAAPGELLKSYTITDEDVAGPFVEVTGDMEAMSALEVAGYKDIVEALAERFHMSQSLLKALNPGVDLSQAGTEIMVVAPGRKALRAQVARIEVDKVNARLTALDTDGKIVASFPATVGSAAFPSPTGEMEVQAIAATPVYYFDPKGREWGPDRRLTIAAGPNNPVGSTWIDLSEEGYGIHGSPDPQLIGKTASHGCVRLTNWDVQALSRAVSAGTKVVFLEG
jgi:lipoprotein-anchoring transpeptidase ErfK/SrfK